MSGFDGAASPRSCERCRAPTRKGRRRHAPFHRRSARACLAFGGIVVTLGLAVAPGFSYAGASGTSRAPRDVQVFLVRIGGGGRHGRPIGCGDSLIGYREPGPAASDPLAASIGALLALPSEPGRPAGLYNALGRSALHLVSATVVGGVARVALTGELHLGGVCDGPRVASQLEATATQFPHVHRAEITINGRPLAQVLSLRDPEGGVRSREEYRR